MNLIGAVSTAADYYMGKYERFYEASLLPVKTGGTNTGDVVNSYGANNYEIIKFRAKKEYLEQIDDFFTRFGYKINRVKVPNITGRRNFNYVEIGQSDEIGIGDVPHKYMEQINQTARKGVTIWHNHANIGNFSVQNDILS